MGAYFATSPGLPIPERIGQMLKQAGTSIFITSATDVVAFGIGAWTSLPALQHFSVFAALAILFVFLYHITLFAAALTLDAHRERAARTGASCCGSCSACCCGACRAQPDEEAAAPVNGLGLPPDVLPTTAPAVPSMTALNKAASAGGEAAAGGDTMPGPYSSKQIFGKGLFDPQAPTLITRIVGTRLARVVLSPWGKAVCLTIEALLLALAIYGCTRVYMDFQYKKYVGTKLKIAWALLLV